MKKLLFLSLIICCLSCDNNEAIDFPFDVFPNPVVNTVNLITDADAEVVLLDIEGEILADTLINANTMTSWNIEDAQEGVLHFEVKIGITTYRKPVYKITE